MIEASAPGKLVLSGEYAVLAGAPALVAAVDRRVTCTLKPRTVGGWRFSSVGYEAVQTLARSEVYRAKPDSLPGIVRRLLDESAAPEHLEVRTDSTACYLDGAKLGLGSSAAVVAALAAALAVVGGGAPGLAELYDIHAAFQGGGSGLDVAAAVTGGVIRFQDRRVVPARLPPLAKAFYFAGTSTKTADLIGRFDAWRGAGKPAALDRLIEAAVAVADCTSSTEPFLDALSEYCDVLERMDRLARIGVFGPAHAKARDLAERCRVVYKPCGAGGGDMGIALAADPNAVGRFGREAEVAGLTVVPMEFARDGIRVRTD